MLICVHLSLCVKREKINWLRVCDRSTSGSTAVLVFWYNITRRVSYKRYMENIVKWHHTTFPNNFTQSINTQFYNSVSHLQPLHNYHYPPSLLICTKAGVWRESAGGATLMLQMALAWFFPFSISCVPSKASRDPFNIPNTPLPSPPISTRHTQPVLLDSALIADMPGYRHNKDGELVGGGWWVVV